VPLDPNCCANLPVPCRNVGQLRVLVSDTDEIPKTRENGQEIAAMLDLAALTPSIAGEG